MNNLNAEHSGEKADIFRPLPVVPLRHRPLTWLHGSIESLDTEIAYILTDLVPKIREDDSEGFVNGAKSEAGRTARRRLTTPPTLDGEINLEADIQILQGLAEISRHLQSETVDELRAYRAFLVSELGQRYAERPLQEQRVKEVLAQFDPNILSPQAYGARLYAQLNALYPTDNPFETQEANQSESGQERDKQEKPARIDPPLSEERYTAFERLLDVIALDDQGNVVTPVNKLDEVIGASGTMQPGEIASILGPMKNGNLAHRHLVYVMLRAIPYRLAGRVTSPSHNQEKIAQREVALFERIRTLTGIDDPFVAVEAIEGIIDDAFGKKKEAKT